MTRYCMTLLKVTGGSFVPLLRHVHLEANRRMKLRTSSLPHAVLFYTKFNILQWLDEIVFVHFVFVADFPGSLITQRRSVVKNAGCYCFYCSFYVVCVYQSSFLAAIVPINVCLVKKCFQRRLFVCVFVNTITSERENVG